MTDDTILLERASADAGGSTGGMGLPSDLLKQSRRRVKFLASFLLVGIAVDMISEAANLISGPPDTLLQDMLLVHVLWFVVSGLLVTAASSDKVRTSTLLNFALVYEVLLCLSIAITNPLQIFRETGTLPQLHWVTPLIIVFPLVVPCPPRRTLVTALLAGSTAPLGLLILQSLGAVTPTLDSYLAISLGPCWAVLIAYFGSKVVYGLGLEVAEARRLGSYQLERLLGRGGMGEVWLAKHRLLIRPAAIKLVRPELVGGSKGQANTLILRRFEREAQATASMRSPHTVELYDFGITADGTLFYVMELLDGFNAQTLIKDFGPIPAGRAVHILRQVCHSLVEAHEAGLVHRDIKPANIFVCRYGREVDFVKVLDFGLVKNVQAPGAADDVTLTAEFDIAGTPVFMAPEQALDGNQTDARSDIYAVGCVAYWLLTGTTVFTGKTTLEVLLHHAQTRPTAPSLRSEAFIPEPLDRVILDCLQKDPALRPQTAALLAERLAACIETSPQEAWTLDRRQEWWRLHQPAAVNKSA